MALRGGLVYAVWRCCGLKAVVFIVEVSGLVMGFTRVEIAIFRELRGWSRLSELALSVSTGNVRLCCSISCREPTGDAFIW